MHCWFEPGAQLPEHFYPTLEEQWEVIEGTIQLKVGGHWRWLTDAARAARDGAFTARGLPTNLRSAFGSPRSRSATVTRRS